MEGVASSDIKTRILRNTGQGIYNDYDDVNTTYNCEVFVKIYKLCMVKQNSKANFMLGTPCPALFFGLSLICA